MGYHARYIELSLYDGIKGMYNVLKDISYVYKISLESAKDVYKRVGLGNSKNASNLDKVEIKDNNGDKLIVNQVNLSEIIESRVQEILRMAKKQINTLTKRQISYIICTGGIANIGDFDLNVLEVFSITLSSTCLYSSLTAQEFVIA